MWRAPEGSCYGVYSAFRRGVSYKVFGFSGWYYSAAIANDIELQKATCCSEIIHYYIRVTRNTCLGVFAK